MAKEMETVRSCGFLVVRGRPVREFLLMKHKVRWDLPKGHVDPGETDLDCAFRELWEETGIPADALKVDPTFQFVHQYPVRTNRVKSGRAMKTLVIFLGQLLRDVKIKTTEHPSYAWLPWEPPHRIQVQTIDPLLKSVEEYLTEKR